MCIRDSYYIDGGFMVGELPAAGVPDQWGLLLQKDSPLTARVSNAVDTLRADGTLDALEKEWLSVLTEGVPQLK